MKAFLNHISLTQKLLAMGVLALVLFALPASQNWQRARDELATAEHERTGLAPMSLATMLLDLIQQQRRDSTALLVSGKGREKVTAAQAKVQAQLDALRSDKLVAGSKQLSADVAEMSKAQADIASRLAASTTVDENFDAHIALVDHTLALQASIAGETGLDLDPEATSYYLFDAAYNQLPPLVEALARARGYGVGAITAGSGNAGATELAAKAAISTRFALSMFTQVQDRLKKAALAQLASDDKEMATELDGIKQQMAGQVAEASNLANKLKSANFGNVSAEQYAAAFNTIIGSAYQTSSKLNKLLDGELDQRVERIKGDLRRLQLWTAILVLVLLASITAISLSLSRPMAAAVAAASRIADGDLDDAHIRQNGRNETSRLLNSLDDMRLKLKATLERERAIATENSRIRTALDCASAAVMIGDPQRQIVYANQSVRRLLQETEAEIRKALPQFNARDIIGKHVDDFHGNASHVQRVIDGMQGVHKARLHLGERHFVLSMNRVVDEAGTFLGTAVEWTDETEALREIERERNRAAAQARILAALDNTSVNVMIADASRTIIYMNGAVERMLRHAEADLRKVLPQFSVDKIIGSNIDSFHKNPSHQASLLATFTSTYQSKIQVGARHFHLTANPIINSEGERLGSVVEWRDITREVAIESEVAELIRGANQGDFTTRLSLSDKDGFFKILAENLNSLMEVSERGLAEVVRMLGALAQGDLTQRIDGDYAGTFGQLKDDSNATAEKLAEIITQIKEASDTIGTASQEIAAGNQNLSNRTESQAASLEETASSMEELTSTVKQNAENAKQANQLARGASDIAVRGGEVVGQVVSTMQDINASARKIVDIISVIDGIAFQTNILALNAAVEAARAGEQGRGFAVVASEVRNLAQRSAAAAKEIKTLIGDSVNKVEAGSKLVNDAGRTMEEVVNSVKRVTDIMSEISAASVEQSAGIEQVNTTITQMDDMTQQNAALVEQAAAAAQSMADQSNTLAQAVAAFRLAQASNRARPLAAKPPLALPASSKPATRALSKPGKAETDDWEEF